MDAFEGHSAMTTQDAAHPGRPVTEIGVRELRENLAAYMSQVKDGATILITSHDKIIAELRPPAPELRPRRQPGTLKGKIWIAPDFDATPQDMLDSIEGDGFPDHPG